MTLQLLKNEVATIERYTESSVNGRNVVTLTSTFTLNCTIMPADTTEASDKATETNVVDVAAQRNTAYKKIYTKTKLQLKDVVVDSDGIRYKVHKLYDYSKFGTVANHYKAVIVKVED